MSKNNLHKRLESIRKNKGYSQKKISEISGINQSFLSKVEQGKSIPSSDFLLVFYANLNIDINWLLTGEGEAYIEKKPRSTDNIVLLGERLKQIRNYFNFTQDEFGKKLSVNHSFISRIEKNNSAMGAEFLYELNRQFNVNINWLLAGDGPMFLTRLKLAEPVDPNVVDNSTLEERMCKLLEMINIMGRNMTEEQLCDVAKYVQEKKRLSELEELAKKDKKRA